MRNAQGCAAGNLAWKDPAREQFVAIAVDQRELVANLSIAADEIGVAGISLGCVLDSDDARDGPIGIALIHRSGGDLVGDAEMFFDGGDALESVVDFNPEAGDVVDFLSEVIEFDPEDA